MYFRRFNMKKIIFSAFAFVFIVSGVGNAMKMITNKNFVIIQDFESKILTNKRTIRVYLPENYFNSSEYYPVIYAQDGQNLFFDPNNKMKWDLDKNIEKLTKEDKIKDVIVVGIDHMGVQRITEYTPFPFSSYGGGKGKLYGEFLVKEVKPFIEANFRVKTNREDVAVMGSSLGGLISLYIGMWYPEQFGIIGSVSPSYWWGLDKNLAEASNNIKSLKTQKIYIDMGYREQSTMFKEKNGRGVSNVIYTTKEMFLLLQKNGMDYPNLLYIEDLAGEHNELIWKERITNFLIFAFSKKKLSSELKNIEIYYYPNEWGIGDMGYLFVNGVTEDGITRTFLGLTPELEKLKLVDKDRGIIQATDSGIGTISVKIGKLQAKKEIKIEPISSIYCVAEINVVSPTKSVQLVVTNQDKMETNYVVPLLLLDSTNESGNVFSTKITNLRGTIIDADIVDGNGNVLKSVKLIMNSMYKKYTFTLTNK
jgi:predicted alpha/beta superfamily hydrolase